MIKRTGLPILGLLSFISVFGQYYSSHFIAPAPWQYWHNANEIILATPSDTMIEVKLYKSDGLFLKAFSIKSGTPAVFRPDGQFRDFPRHPINKAISGAGIILKAVKPFSVNVRNIASDQLGTDQFIKGNASLTSLGNPGIGTNFRVAYYRDGPLPTENPIYSLMAIEDSTSILLNGSILTLLNKGQSYLFQCKMGSLVSADRPVVMNAGAFLDAPGGCGDGTFDQIPPTSVLGTRYFVVRTQGNNFSEQSTIVATEDNTSILIQRFMPNGNFISGETMSLNNAGDFITISNGDKSTAYSVCEIKSDKKIAIFTGSAQSCEVDVSSMFPVSSPCNGSNFIETTEFKTFNQSSLPYFCYILIEDSAAQVIFNGDELEKFAGSRRAVGATGMYIFAFNSNQVGNPKIISITSKVKLHISIVQIGGGFSMSAAFSNLVEQPLIEEPLYVKHGNCPVTTAVLSLLSEVMDIQWYYNGSPISGANENKYEALLSGIYHVKAKLPCGDVTESIPVIVQLDTIQHSFTTINACEKYFWEDSIYLTSGDFTKMLKDNNGCDSLATIHLDIKNANSSISNYSACDKFIWDINGRQIIESGIYIDTLVNQHNCDSIVYLNLTILKPSYYYQTASSCDSYFWDVTGREYIDGGLYADTLINAFGCDSIVILDLEINKSYHSTVEQIACEEYLWPVNGIKYSKSGKYMAALQSRTGCDSFFLLNLIILESTKDTLKAVACDSFFWSVVGYHLYKSGIYKATYVNAEGCDSLLYLKLTINNSKYSFDTLFHCGPYHFPEKSIVIEKSQAITEQFSSHENCDSIVNTYFEIYPEFTLRDSISVVGEYFWNINHTLYKESGEYTHTFASKNGCDSLYILLLRINKVGDVYVPNVFSPNGDNINDKFIVFSSPEIKVIDRLRIYDRWGEMLYELSNFPPNQEQYGWNGRLKNQALVPAVFVYTVEWTDNLGTKRLFSGDVTLVK